MKKYFVHKTAIIETKNIGDHSRIWAFVHILPEAKIGRNANIGEHCFIENEVTIGNNVTIKNGVSLWDGITLEDNIFIGTGVAFTNDLFPRSKNIRYKQEKTFIKEGASLGANATILAGITIGKSALIGAGAVVTKDVPDYALVYGNPAKVWGYVCACTKKIDGTKGSFLCSCGKSYILTNGGIQEQI